MTEKKQKEAGVLLFLKKITKLSTFIVSDLSKQNGVSLLCSLTPF